MMNVFSRFVCMLLLLPLVSLAQQKITVSTNRLALTAGQATEDAITLTLSGVAGHLNAAGIIQITPPTGWSAFQDDVAANAGYVSVDRGRLDVVGAKAQISAVAATTTSVTVTYRNATASTTTGKAYFTVEYNNGAGDTVLFNDSTFDYDEHKRGGHFLLLSDHSHSSQQ